jgi:hypothetical protein
VWERLGRTGGGERSWSLMNLRSLCCSLGSCTHVSGLSAFWTFPREAGEQANG